MMSVLHDVCASQTRDSETDRTCYMNGDKINACRVSVRKPGEDRPLEIPRHRSEDNIQIDLKGVGMASTRFI